ncbi:hypothetical protein C6502_06160 [Candidatus Poribacteria bacterium]|nr:MAG: hypothetical protein C6502_06160 [Candidatus Poribacteria bacterium]
MKEQNTFVKYTRSEIETLPDETDWERVDALTDEDIDAAASSDPDAPPTDASFWKEATVVMPENNVKEDNFDNIWTEKLRMAEAFLESATVLSAPLKRVERGDSDEQLAEKREVCHFLCAILFELAIKIIWEIENQKEKCNPHHRILEYYKELSPERQSHIRQLYENQLDLVRREKGVDDFAELQSLEEALEANYDAVTSFKYERDFHGKSSVISGLIWKEDDGYVTLPSQYIIFPTEIMRYVRECVGLHP